MKSVDNNESKGRWTEVIVVGLLIVALWIIGKLLEG